MGTGRIEDDIRNRGAIQFCRVSIGPATLVAIDFAAGVFGECKVLFAHGHAPLLHIGVGEQPLDRSAVRGQIERALQVKEHQVQSIIGGRGIRIAGGSGQRTALPEGIKFLLSIMLPLGVSGTRQFCDVGAVASLMPYRGSETLGLLDGSCIILL